MLIDAHQHFWRYNPLGYSWISGSMEPLKRDFMPPDLEPELKALKFDGSVTIQARQSFEETRWLLGLAERYDFIKGVVGWVDLCSNDLETKLMEFSSSKKLVGIRHVLQDEPDDKFMLKKEFLSGISLLAEYDLVYDLLILPRHLPYAVRLVEKFPGQRFVLDHIAKPLINDKKTDPWKHGIEMLASHTNVCCKLSGMVTEASWHNWKQSDFEPYLDIIFNSFGPSRLMIGSDWPVCTLASSYRKAMQIIVDYIELLDQKEKKLILGENAVRIYRLTDRN